MIIVLMTKIFPPKTRKKKERNYTQIFMAPFFKAISNMPQILPIFSFILPIFTSFMAFILISNFNYAFFLYNYLSVEEFIAVC